MILNGVSEEKTWNDVGVASLLCFLCHGQIFICCETSGIVYAFSEFL